MTLREVFEQLERRGGAIVYVEAEAYEVRLSMADLYGEEQAFISMENLRVIVDALEPQKE